MSIVPCNVPPAEDVPTPVKNPRLFTVSVCVCIFYFSYDQLSSCSALKQCCKWSLLGRCCCWSYCRCCTVSSRYIKNSTSKPVWLLEFRWLQKHLQRNWTYHDDVSCNRYGDYHVNVYNLIIHFNLNVLILQRDCLLALTKRQKIFWLFGLKKNGILSFICLVQQ